MKKNILTISIILFSIGVGYFSFQKIYIIPLSAAEAQVIDLIKNEKYQEAKDLVQKIRLNNDKQDELAQNAQKNYLNALINFKTIEASTDFPKQIEAVQFLNFIRGQLSNAILDLRQSKADQKTKDLIKSNVDKLFGEVYKFQNEKLQKETAAFHNYQRAESQSQHENRKFIFGNPFKTKK